MSLNKFMHPRNIYKVPPNFKELAILYPDFRKHAKQDVAGKITINFQDQEALRALTTALLKKDFGLEVEIPSDRLVPTLPLRLNYLLWIEDLLALGNGNPENSVRGIDIGTGASCIYPLLAAKKNGWHMIATETDHQSAEAAKVNVENNNLQELIRVQLVDQDQVLIPLVGKEEKYDFCMCNPPFFKNEEEIDLKNKSRTAARPPPRNAWTGSVDEVVTPGGEVALICKIVEESLQLRNSIRVYTTMVGVKSDLRPSKEELLRYGIKNTATTEFCQGRTTRWGLAWSFSDEPNLQEACGKLTRKKLKPMAYVVPPTSEPDSYTVEQVCEKVKELLNRLQVKYKELRHSTSTRIMSISAAQNTWSKQRRLRREMQKKLKVNTDGAERKSDETMLSAVVTCSESQSGDAETETKSGTTVLNEIGDRCSDITCRGGSNMQSQSGKQCQPQKREMEVHSEGLQPPVKKMKTEKLSDSVSEQGENALTESVKNAKTSKDSPVLNASLVVRKDTDIIRIELAYIDGSSGKDGVHQVLQYIRNNLK